MGSDTYKKRAAVLEAFRRGRFYFWAAEDTRSRYEKFITSEDLMEGRLSQHMKQQFLRYGTRLETPTFPLIATLAQHKAVAFREGMTIELLDPESGMAVSSDAVPVVQYLPSLVQSTGLWAAMAKADSYLVSHHSGAIWIRFSSSGRLYCSCLPPYCLDVEPGEVPGDPSTARRIVVPSNGDAYPVDDSKEERISYECIFDEQARRFVWYAAPVDANGKPLSRDLVEAPDALLRVQAHPVIIWNEEDCDSPIAPLPKDLLHAQEHVNMLLAETQLAFRAGAHGQAYLRRGMNADPFGDAGTVKRVILEEDPDDTATLPKVGTQNVALQGGVDSIPVIPPGWDLALLQSRVDAIEHMRYIEAHIKLTYMSQDMVVSRADIFNPQPSNYSASSKMLDAAPLEDAQERRERRLAALAERTLDVWRGYYNQVASPGMQIPEGYAFRVSFPGQWSPAVLTDQSHQQGLQLAFENGLADPVAIVASLEGVSRREASMRLEARKRRVARVPAQNTDT